MSIYKKLFEAKKEIGVISKDAKNPFFKSNYLSLNGLIDAVDSVLEKHGLLMLQPIEDNCVKTQIFDIEEGRTSILQSVMQLPDLKDPQKIGSAITYYRRYTLQSLLGLQAEDDDGNKAVKPPKPVKVDYTRQETALKACETKEDFKKTWLAFSSNEKTALTKLKNELIIKLDK